MNGIEPPPGNVAGSPPKALVLVFHGGEEASTRPTAPTQLAVLRMAPITRAIRHALADRQVWVIQPRFTVRGWNGDAASPVGDLIALLDSTRIRYGAVPVTMVGHSMGARAVLRAAGHPSVCAVAALAPWVPPGEPVTQLAGRKVLLAHGDRDRITRPADTWAFADHAREITQVTAIEVSGSGHAMLRRARLWHSLAAGFARAALGDDPAEGPLAAALRDAGPGRVTV